jgi:hypothetical protein
MATKQEQRVDEWDRIAEPVAADYASARTQVLGHAGSKGFGDVLKPLDDALALTAKKRQGLAALRSEHQAGNVANDQVPKLRDRMVGDARATVDAAVKASEARLRDLRASLEVEAFRPPARGTHSAEAKADIERAMANQAEPASALIGVADRAVANRDALVLALVVSDFGSDLARKAGVPSVMELVRPRALANPDIFGLEPGAPGTMGKDGVTSPRVPALKALARLDDLDRTRMLGLNYADMEAQRLERGYA